MKRILVSSFLALSLSACTITPKPLTTGAVKSFASDTLGRVTLGQEPVTNAITLYEAMARALKYNLDFKVEMYNEALASKQLASARLEALPNLVANAGYVGRNNNSGNTGSLTFPDKDKFQNDITLSWNILDFGLSKVRAEQAADEVLVATERRRKIINRVIEDVRTAYWRTISADRLVEGLRRLEGRTKKALRNSQALQRDGMSSPLTALTYQRELVEIQQRIQRLQKDLSLAKMQLAALMNIRPGEHFSLAMPKRHAATASLDMSAEDMVFAALENRPEIRDVQYKLRINKKETKALLLELLPGINLFGGANIDSDSYLLNSNWVGWGAKATFNLFNVFKYPARKRTVQAKDEVLDARALAVTMAIMTQVHVSRIRYGHAQKLYRTASRHLKVQKGILGQIKASHREGQASEQTLIREEMNTLASRVSADIAYADLQNAYANIFASMGVDPYAGDLKSSSSVSELAGELRELWIERGDRSGVVRAKHSATSHLVTSSINTRPNAGGESVAIVKADDAWAGLEKPSSVNAIPARKKRSFFAALVSGGDNGRRANRNQEPGN
ncbi:MAG: TolC family protein [Pseudomonadota bacterium]